MFLSKAELETLIVLIKSSRGLDAFSLFRRLNVPFSDFTKIISNLSDADYIEEVKDDYVRISKAGRNYVNQQEVTASRKHWRDVPDRFLGLKLKDDSFYIPSIRLLDKTTFNIEINDDNEVE